MFEHESGEGTERLLDRASRGHAAAIGALLESRKAAFKQWPFRSSMENAHERLLRDASGRAPRSLESLVKLHLPGLLAYVRLHAGRQLLAKESSIDLVQSACREVLQDLPARGFGGEGEFKRWLYTAAERKLLDRAKYYARARRDPRREAFSLQQPSSTEAAYLIQPYATCCTPSQIAMAREELAQLEKAFNQLPDDYRDVILRSRLLGLKHGQIAQEMGRSEAAVRVLLHRALARLARLMEPGSS